MPLDLSIVPPDLRRLDDLQAEVIACGIWEDERPFRGLAGLVDWRLAGRLSAIARSGFLTGKEGEHLLCPGRPRLPFDQVLVFGLGRVPAFDESTFARAVDALVAAIVGLEARRTVVELPGRGDGRIDAERAADLAAPRYGPLAYGAHVWVEAPEHEKRVVARIEAYERRVRAKNLAELGLDSAPDLEKG